MACKMYALDLCTLYVRQLELQFYQEDECQPSDRLAEAHSHPSTFNFTPYVFNDGSCICETAESAVLANDLRPDGFVVVALDTGWVRTETGNTTETLGHGSAPLDVLTSVAGQLCSRPLLAGSLSPLRPC